MKNYNFNDPISVWIENKLMNSPFKLFCIFFIFVLFEECLKRILPITTFFNVMGSIILFISIIALLGSIYSTIWIWRNYKKISPPQKEICPHCKQEVP